MHNNCSEDFIIPSLGRGAAGCVFAGRGLYVIKANKSDGETPPYTLPREGIAQSHVFLFLPNTYGLHTGCLGKAIVVNGIRSYTKWCSRLI
jgi:hypothetical protein